ISGLEIGQCAELPNLEIFDQLIVKYDTQPQANGFNQQNSFDFNDSPEQFGDIDEIIKKGVPKGQRSEAFQHVINRLEEQSLNAGEIEARLRKYPGGIANKYWSRLRQEIERSFAKWQEWQGKTQQEANNYAPFICRVKRGGDFIAEYEPIIYTID